MNIIKLTDQDLSNLTQFLDRVPIKGLTEVQAMHILLNALNNTEIENKEQM